MREYHKWRIYYKKRVSVSAHATPRPMAVPAVGPGHQRAQRRAMADREQDAAGSYQRGRGMLAVPMVPVGGSLVWTPSPAAGSAAVCSGSLTWADCGPPGAGSGAGFSRALTADTLGWVKQIHGSPTALWLGWDLLARHWHAAGSHISARQHVLPGRPGGSASLRVPALRHAGTTTLAARHAGWSVVQPPPQPLARDR